MSSSFKKLYPNEPIAIIGAACRFPGGAVDLEGFWELLKNGVDCISSLPEDRCSLERFFSKAKRFGGHAYSHAAGIVEHIKEFDPEFFGISRKEAQNMDPQQRLALEVAWEALEHAHIVPSALRGSRSGVFMGASNMDMAQHRADDPSVITAYANTCSALSIISNRISYFLDLRGPSITVDTACSSSLTALHMACEELRTGRIPLAIVGGVNILLSPFPFIGFARARMMSPTGRCSVFDAAGDGYVRGEGAGAVVLKPLSQALTDGDSVLAVIEGSGVNFDGRTTGMFLPSGDVQAALIEDIYKRFRLDKNKLAYVEAHGTGTTVGDPIEAKAVGETLGKALKGTRSLLVGSVKSNIGHLEPASGMAGLLKAILVLRHGEIPPNLHFTTPNPAIDFDGLNLAVPTAVTALPELGGDELISINSFGFGGANAHLVLRKPEQKSQRVQGKKAAVVEPPFAPFFLSAQSPLSLAATAGRYGALLKNANASQCYNVAATLALCRESMKYRALVVASSQADLLARLKKLEKSKDSQGGASPITEAIPGAGAGVFVFTGNGSQWLGMGTTLLAADGVFRDAVEEVDSLFTPLAGWSLLDVLCAPEKHAEAFEYAEKNQPLLFAVQMGLVRALAAKGVTPSAVVGHSVGEVAAAATAGIISLADAVRLIYCRSALQAPTRGMGGMAVANMTEAQAANMLASFKGAVSIAAVNTEFSLTLAGETNALRAVLQCCKQERIAAKLISVPYPFHTQAMDIFQADFLRSQENITPQRGHIPFFSTVTKGKRATKLDTKYWWRNLRQTVQFAAAVDSLLDQGYRLFLEVGPAPLLRSYLRDTSRKKNIRIFAGMTLSRQGDAGAELDDAWKSLWKNGWKLDTAKHFPYPWQTQDIPLYAWNREYLWLTDSAECRGFIKESRKHPLLGWQLPGAIPAFENTLNLTDFPWLADHKTGKGTPYPAAAFIESMLAAARELHPKGGLELTRIALHRPLQLSMDTSVALRLSVDEEDGGILIESRQYAAQEPFTPCARGRIIPFAQREFPSSKNPISVTSPQSFGVEVSKETLYTTAERFSLHYGPAFQSVEQAWVRSVDDTPEILVRFAPPEPQSAQGMLIPPTLLDGAFQSLFLLLGARLHAFDGQVYLPAAFARVVLYSPGIPRFAYTKMTRISPRSVEASFLLVDADGNPLLALSACRFRRAAWLEQEHAAPEPYIIDLESCPHPNEPQAAQAFSLQTVCKKMGEELAFNVNAQDASTSVHPYLLLQFATLSAIHESVLALCGSPSSSCDLVIEDLLGTGKLAPDQEPWLRHMLERLESAELALPCDGFWKISPRGQRPPATMLWRTLVSSAPSYSVEALLLAYIIEHCGAILQGDYSAGQQKILPAALCESYFNNASVLFSFITPLVKCLRTVLHECKGDSAESVLQLAKNNKVLLTQILPVLRSHCCRYVVGEKSPAAADALASLFDRESNIVFRGGALEELGQDQHGKFRLLLSAFAFHDQENTVAALRECFEMLAPGGILCLMEHAPSAFMDYVFGAEPSWWNASVDMALPVSRLQTRDAWKQELRSAGFVEVADVWEENDAAAPAFIVLAQKPLAVSEAVALSSAVSPAKDLSSSDAAPCWLLVSAEQGTLSAGLAAGIADTLRHEGKDVMLLRQGDAVGKIRFTGKTATQWASLFALVQENVPLHVVYVAGYDNEAERPAKKLAALQVGAATELAAFAAAWEAFQTNLRLWVVTGGAFAKNTQGTSSVEAFFSPIPSQGSLAGFVRVMGNELRGLPLHLIDLHGKTPLLSPVLRELLHPTEEPEVVLCGEERFVPRLARLAAAQATGGATQVAGGTLTFDKPGRLQNLYWDTMSLPVPGPGMVRVAVRCAGLNFRDVMWSMGLLPDEALENGFSGPTMGIECSGIVDAVGKDVTEFSVGDAVFGFAPACFSSYVVTPAGAVARKPVNMRHSEAASLPVAFFTAWYAIKHLANMQKGERILIHGAAGGVGLAALQIASHLGLEVYATVGAPEKQAFLRKFGVQHIFSSRSLAFAPQILEATNGQGVDAVLNSLAGEAISAGLSVLRPFGRFLELGKRDFYADSPMRLRPFSNNLSYFGIDVDQLFAHQPVLARNLFRELAELFGKRTFVPLSHTVFSASRVVEAFQSMQQATHTGKLIVSLNSVMDEIKPDQGPLERLRLSGEGSYLITGGTGGLGLATARRLVKRGAKHILLLSRRGMPDAQSARMIEDMQRNGVSVHIAAVDVADSVKLRACLKKYSTVMPPLKGVIHSAAMLEDGMVASLDAGRIHTSLAAKSLGAWNLHKATLECPLDFFVLYSSATTAFGNPGQAGYVAANSMLETLASWRKQQNLPATVIGWGPIGDIGMLARNERARQVLHTVLGVSPLNSSEALDWLEHCLVRDIDANHYFGLHWQKSAGQPERAALGGPRFARLRSGRKTSAQNAEVAPLDFLRTCSRQDGVAFVTDLLMEDIAGVLRLPKDKLVVDAPLVTLGMDSLMGMELSLTVEQQFALKGYTLPIAEDTTITSLAEALYARVAEGEADDGNDKKDSGADRELLLSLERKHKAHLTDEEREAVLQSLK